MTVQAKSFSEILHYRRSVRKFDPTKPIDASIVKQCLEKATLAPNSSNMQLWEFHQIVSQEKLERLSKNCFNQSASKTAQQMIVVVVRKDLWRQRKKAHISHLINIFGNKTFSQYSNREKMALQYYKKVVPLAYFDFLGIVGYLKFSLFWVIGLFIPIYRQARNSDMRIVVHKSAGLAAQTFMLSMTDAGYDTCPMEGIDSLRIKRMLNLPLRTEINMVIACGIRLEDGIYGDRFRIPFDEVYKKW